ncbi:MAG TPA: hypothetical protein VF465_19460 [Flavobacterium sp.]|nr:hypothetical protein [uncultured Flavobacterium sp.]
MTIRYMNNIEILTRKKAIKIQCCRRIINIMKAIRNGTRLAHKIVKCRKV